MEQNPVLWIYSISSSLHCKPNILKWRMYPTLSRIIYVQPELIIKLWHRDCADYRFCQNLHN